MKFPPPETLKTLEPGRSWLSSSIRAVGVFSLLALGAVQLGCEAEKAKWNLARAMNLSEADQIDEAIALSQIASDQDPDNCEIKLYLARLLAENGKGEIAIALCDVHHQGFPNDLPAREVRSMCLKYLGRFDEALVDYKKSLSGRVKRTPAELNNLAYFRALAKTELSKAAEDIQEAIRAKELEYLGRRRFPFEVRTMVAAGLISRHVDRRRPALRLLDRMIVQYEEKLAQLNRRIQSSITQQVKTSFPLNRQQQDQVLKERSIREIEKSSLAFLLTVRALILEDFQRTQCVDDDRRRIEELGFDLEKLIEELPSDQACLNALGTAAIFLDTRGFISAVQPWQDPTSSLAFQAFDSSARIPAYQTAIEDLDLAVMSAQLRQAALNSPLYNSMEISAEQVKRQKRMARRETAVLLYHRLKAHERGGNEKAAAKDQCQIEAIGFAPDESLF